MQYLDSSQTGVSLRNKKKNPKHVVRGVESSRTCHDTTMFVSKHLLILDVYRQLNVGRKQTEDARVRI